MPVQHSSGWKTIQLRIAGSDETLELPVMIASKVWELKCQLAEHCGIKNPGDIQLQYKNGCSWKTQRNGDEVQSRLIVKGIASFAKLQQNYPHPYAVIGAGHMGLRMAMHLERKRLDYAVFERRGQIGGNAWVSIANHQSKLQSEGPAYQLTYESSEGIRSLVPDYGYWPSRAQILRHFEDVSKSHGVWPHLHLNTEVVDCSFVPPGRGQGWETSAHNLVLQATGDRERPAVDSFNSCCVAFFPGCLTSPHRKVWPGEEVFGGTIGYGLANEFDYNLVEGAQGVVIGMGAFAAENVRTCCEYGAKKTYVVARHFNLLLPRVCSWYINQAMNMPPAALVLDAMVPMYKLVKWDPWAFFSVTPNADRTAATIKQYTRWGIGDAIFIAIYFDKAEIIESEVKRFKPRQVVLVSGKVLSNIDHVIKVIGFDGDFGADKIMHAQKYSAHWPEGDWRRWVMSDQSAIDASRFAGTGLSPFCEQIAKTLLWYFRNPAHAHWMASSGDLPVGRADFEKGSPGYHYDPRTGTAVWLKLSQSHPDLVRDTTPASELKRDAFWSFGTPEGFLEECKADWQHYAIMFHLQGSSKPIPEYPYDMEFLSAMHEKDLQQEEKDKARYAKSVRLLENHKSGQAADGGQPPDLSAEAIESEMGQQGQQERPRRSLSVEPNSDVSFAPMKAVLGARSRSNSPSPNEEERERFLSEGRAVQQWIREQAQA